MTRPRTGSSPRPRHGSSAWIPRERSNESLRSCRTRAGKSYYGTRIHADQARLKHNDITEKIIEAFFRVYNSLGYGFLEKVYENSLIIALKKLDLNATPQWPIKVFYEGALVGEYFADILVENSVIVEIKAAKNIAPEHEAQLLNYLKATDLEVGLILNFGPKAEFKRKAFDNSGKKLSSSLNPR